MKPCPVGITALTCGPDILIPLLWERGVSHSFLQTALCGRYHSHPLTDA